MCHLNQVVWKAWNFSPRQGRKFLSAYEYFLKIGECKKNYALTEVETGNRFVGNIVVEVGIVEPNVTGGFTVEYN